MRKIGIGLLALTFTVAATACDDDDDGTGPEVERFVAALAAPEGVNSTATGTATFEVTGDQLTYTISSTGLTNVTAAHIHNSDGGAVLIPLPDINATGQASGTTTITNMDHLALMRSGDTYVNVHTNDGVDPPNSGPGDFQSGEIQGDLVPQ